MLELWKAGPSQKRSLNFLPTNASLTYTCTTPELDVTRAALIALSSKKCFEFLASEAEASRQEIIGDQAASLTRSIAFPAVDPKPDYELVQRVRQTMAGFRQTIGRKRPTTSCNRPVIWPSEQTSAASSNAGKQFSPRSTMSPSFCRARFAFSAFFFLNLAKRVTCSCCFDLGVRASSISGISSAPSRYRFRPTIGRVPS